MSEWLRSRVPKVCAGDVVEVNRIFPCNAAQQMLNVHLFFLKQFGCLIEDSQGDIVIDLMPFAAAILEGRSHPKVYLEFGIGPTVGDIRFAARSEFMGVKGASGSVVLGLWLYQVGDLIVKSVYAEQGEVWKNKDCSWHPRQGIERFVMVDCIGGFEDP